MLSSGSILVLLVFISPSLIILTNPFDLGKFKSKMYNTELKSLLNCTNEPVKNISELRGKFWVLYNYVQPTVSFSCHEAVTYTTHADYSFLDNLETLSRRWNGPISLAVYAPGKDFDVVLKSIAYLRTCRHKAISKFVTFHIFFDVWHMPKKASVTESHWDSSNCNIMPPYKFKKIKSYRYKNNLTYPINVARNIARLTAQTYFVFPSDIELYPVHNFSRRFLDMIIHNSQYQGRSNRRVYVVPVFEITGQSKTPSNKTELQHMLSNKTAKEFHVGLCSVCHRVPNITQWIATKESSDFHVFVVAKRKGKYKHWEPFYVGTQKEPLFDERLTWEGQSNKITQAFAMCLLDYDYMVLDNAFLAHKPGIKKYKDQLIKFSRLVVKTNVLIRNVIKPELFEMYGKRPGCRF